ncbi:hypothetical protein ACEPPN_000368 [Leptodophora sp. 'Broadleaf-Isolate-01']
MSVQGVDFQSYLKFCDSEGSGSQLGEREMQENVLGCLLRDIYTRPYILGRNAKKHVQICSLRSFFHLSRSPTTRKDSGGSILNPHIVPPLVEMGFIRPLPSPGWGLSNLVLP